ncbi:MAG: hypothetical protein AABY87_08000 [bacterium]
MKSRIGAMDTVYILCTIVIGLSLLGGGGCMPKRAELGTRFFPPPPNPPKIQFLKRVSSSKDVEKDSKFEAFVVGGVKANRFGKPYGVAVHDGVIYICDAQLGTVIVVDLINKKFDWLHDQGQGKLSRPINMTIDKDGTKFVADYDRQQVLVYDSNNEFVRAFGNKKQFKPIGVAVYGDKLYVADTQDHEVEVLDKKTGERLDILGEPGLDEGQFYHPTNVSVDHEGNLYVTDTINFRIQKFDSDGNFLLGFGEAGDVAGNFSRPKGNAVDRNDFIYVVDSGFENVQVFTPEGEIALFFGGWGDALVPGALWLPAGICITYDEKLLNYFEQIHHKDFLIDYLILVTSQYGPPYINIYAFGKAREGSPLEKGEGEKAYLEGKEKKKPEAGSVPQATDIESPK